MFSSRSLFLPLFFDHSDGTAQEGPDFSEISLRLAKKIEDDQNNIIQNQNWMLHCLSIIENEIEEFKAEIEELTTKQSAGRFI